LVLEFLGENDGKIKVSFIHCVLDGSKNAYLKRYLDVEDKKNGYMKGGAEAGQGGFEMTLFKKSNGKYVVGLYSFNEAEDNFYFLEYRNKKWLDVSKKLVQEYSDKCWYVFPRYGTKIEVFERKIDADGMTEKGDKLYDLVWEKDAFSLSN
jgi:hypothetical protein